MHAIKTNDRIFRYSHTIGSQSPGGPGFRYPVDLALTKDDIIYVVNRGHDGEEAHRVSVLTTDSEYIGQFGSNGKADGQFIWPVAIAIDKNGLVYLADEWLNRISVYDYNVDFGGLDFEQKNFLFKWGLAGSTEGHISAPAGLAFDSNDNLYISEGDNHRVSKFTKSGKFLMTFGAKGSSPGQFNTPWGITIDDKGFIYVADWGNDRVQKFTSEGDYVMEFGIPGDVPGRLRLPSSLAVDRDGDVYITDWWNNKVEVYAKDGSHLSTLIGHAEEVSKWGKAYLENNPSDIANRNLVTDFEPEYRFMMPSSVAVNDQGYVFVVDSIRFRIQVYQKTRKSDGLSLTL